MIESKSRRLMVRGGKTAPHIAAKRRLTEYIKSVPASASRQLPPEPLLAKELGLSVWAMKKALLLLAQEGRIVIVPRKGNFISSTPRPLRIALVCRDVSVKSTCLGSPELLGSLFSGLGGKVSTINSVQAAKPREVVEIISSYDFDGVIFIDGSCAPDELIEAASGVRVPFVSISAFSEGPRLPRCVYLGHETSGRLRTEFVLAKGHKSVACLSCKGGPGARGFIKAFEAAARPDLEASLFEVSEISRRLPRLLDGRTSALILDGPIARQAECFEIVERHPRRREIEVLLDFAGPESLAFGKAHPAVKIIAFNKSPIGEMGRFAAAALLKSVETGEPAESKEFTTVLLRPDGREIGEGRRGRP